MPRIEETIQQNKQKLTKRGPGGVLTEESPEEIQTLAGKAGLQATPTTPVGGMMVGANQNQAKMMGTPAQKMGALSFSQAPVEEGLAAAQRRAQPRSIANQSEEAQKEKSESLKQLGSLGERVGQFIDAQRTKLAQASQPVAVQAAQQFQGKDISSIKPLIEQLRADPTNMDLMLQVNKALGYDVNTQLDPNQIDALYEGAVDSISRGGAGNVDDDLTISDLINQGNFGYDQQQLSDLLGLPPDQIAGMNVGQLRNQINKLTDEEFSKTQQLEQKATSAQLGQAERGLARQAAQEASRTGLRSTEADVHNLESQIANADQVQFGGRTYKVDDLLKDETISGIISDYMNAGPDSELRKQIDRAEPALSSFIQKNQALLEDASKQLQSQAGEFQGIQASNKQLSNVGGIQLDPTIAKAVIPGYGELQSSKIDPNSSPLLAHVQNNPQGATKIADALNSQEAQDPTFASQLQELSPEDWDKLNIEGNGQAWANYQAIARQGREAQAATDPSDILSQLFTDVNSVDDAKKTVSDNFFMNVIGAGNDVSARGAEFLDRNNDGILDVDSLRDYNLQANGPKSLKETLDQNAKPYQRQTLGQAYIDPVVQGIQNELADAVKDHYIDADELGQANFSWDEMEFLKDKTPSNNIDSDALSAKMDQYRNDSALRSIDKVFQKYPSQLRAGSKEYKAAFSELEQLLRETKGDPSINREIIQNAIDSLASGVVPKTGQLSTKSNFSVASSPKKAAQHAGETQANIVDQVMSKDPSPQGKLQAKVGRSATKSIGKKVSKI